MSHRSAFLSLVLFSVVFHAVLGAAEPLGGPQIRLSHNRKEDSKAYFDVLKMGAADCALLAGAKLDPEEWHRFFVIRVYAAPSRSTVVGPPVLGTYSIIDGGIRFEPRFPLTPGLAYEATFDRSQIPGQVPLKKAAVIALFPIPKPAVVATTVVEQVYPTRNQLPENQLKFYIHFSSPMSRGEAYQHVRLVDSKGKLIELPFLELGEELWDPDCKRFTLFFDPGRIKRGLKPREEVGPSIEEGKSYTLVIDRNWSDAHGNPLKVDFRKHFSVTAPIEQIIETKTWKVQAPQAAKSEGLIVTFPRPLDHALLQRMLWVIDADGKRVAGTITTAGEETRWQFMPNQAWQVGSYHLVVNSSLEDLAGNSIARPFEVDMFRPIQREIQTETVKLAFTVK